MLDNEFDEMLRRELLNSDKSKTRNWNKDITWQKLRRQLKANYSSTVFFNKLFLPGMGAVLLSSLILIFYPKTNPTEKKHASKQAYLLKSRKEVILIKNKPVVHETPVELLKLLRAKFVKRSILNNDTVEYNIISEATPIDHAATVISGKSETIQIDTIKANHFTAPGDIDDFRFRNKKDSLRTSYLQSIKKYKKYNWVRKKKRRGGKHPKHR